MNIKIKHLILKLLLFVFVISITISSCNIVFVLLNYRQSVSVYNSISSLVISHKDVFSETTIPNINVDFKKLKQINPHIKSWLYNEAIGINYPIIQGDDNDYYLKHLPTGEYSENGTLFFDYRHFKNDKHILVYGHNMRDGSMFGNLEYYADQKFYNQYPNFYLYEEKGTYQLNIISSYYTEDCDYTYEFGEQLNMKKYVEYIKEKSYIQTNTEYKDGDCIITFSTCAYLQSDNRFVVHCVTRKI